MSASKRRRSLSHRAYSVTRSFLRSWNRPKADSAAPAPARAGGLKVAMIHNEKRIATGAHHINALMAQGLAERGAVVRSFFPRRPLTDTPVHLKGIANILFFHSLLEHKDEVLKCHIIQGTTYTPLPFLSFNVPVVCHFGSTIRGYLDAVPATRRLPKEERAVYKELVKMGIISEYDLQTFRPMEDVADIEAITGAEAAACVATSAIVRDELVSMGVAPERVHVIHNAIEEYWFLPRREAGLQQPHLVFLGRLGSDVFTLKLKGFSRLVNFYRAFPQIPKTTICMTSNRKLKDWLRVAFPKHSMFVNLRKDLIPGALAQLYGSILFLPSRYEGFSLSLAEGMSQGLVPIAYPVGVVPELIQNGVNGFIVTSQEEACARARELLADEGLRLAMARAAKASVESLRGDRIAGELMNLYQNLRRDRKASANGGPAA